MHSVNRRFGYEYKLNFGIVEGYNRERTAVQGAYIMGVNHPVRNFDGRVIAIIRRHGGHGVVWVVAPKSTRFIVNDIKPAISFAERKNGYDIECLYERSCGAVVFNGKGEDRSVLLIRNRRSAHWGFPKGHIEPGETQHETAIRETKEETGLDISILDGFSCKSEYTIQGKVEKAAGLHEMLSPLFRNCFVESNPIPAKAALAAMGLIRNELRLPLVPCQQSTYDLMADTIRTIGLI